MNSPFVKHFPMEVTAPWLTGHQVYLKKTSEDKNSDKKIEQPRWAAAKKANLQ